MSIKNINKIKCSGCNACVAICPKNCIVMKENKEGFLYPKVDENICVECGLCEKVCQNIGMDTYNINPNIAYAAINNDENCRVNSSSGGIFSLLAEKILELDGVVFGAMMTQDCRLVIHTKVDTKDDLQKLRGSKYLQSMIGDCYLQAELLLKKGRYVLFTGTPCQIAGLRKFLSKDYEKLVLLDVICHGVPSKLVWEKYVDYIEAKYNSKVIKVNFRHKKPSWENFGMSRLYSNSKQIIIPKEDDPYLKMFLKNYSLRESCYNCSNKNVRFSDITLGDFWGVENFVPEMNDGKGTSAVIIRTSKGKELFDSIKPNLKLMEVSYEKIVKYNSAELTSVYRPRERDVFFEDLTRLKFKKMIKKYAPVSAKRKIKNEIRKMSKFVLRNTQIGGG